MNFRESRTRSIISRQWPLFTLLFALLGIHVTQLSLGWRFEQALMLVPSDVTSAWQALLSGYFTTKEAYSFSRLFTHSMLHGSFGHLFWNALYLWVFGALASELLGAKWMLFTFVFTAICGGICHTALFPNEPIPMLGASGAASGFAGLYLAMAFRWNLPEPYIWPIARPIPPSNLVILVVIGLVLDLMGHRSGAMGIAYGAHLGGFVGGLVLGGAIVPAPRGGISR